MADPRKIRRFWFLCTLIACECFVAFSFDAASEKQQPDNVISHYVPRSRRELIEKKLSDPNGCVQRCLSEQTVMADSATTENTHRLIELGMHDAKLHKHRLLVDTDAEMRQRAQELAINNMGPLFEDLCEISKKTDNCLKRCPQSLLRDITLADHHSAAIYCEPAKHWKSFTEYYIATDCYNKTLAARPCDSKCGGERKLSSATRLHLNKDVVKYDTDVAKNTEDAASACKSITCHTDCYHSVITEQCGPQAFASYQRMSKLEPNSALAILGLLQVIEADIPECTRYYEK